jgi:CBS domain-containing protein
MRDSGGMGSPALASRMLVTIVMKLREIMRTGPFTITDIDTLGGAHAAMRRSHVHHLPVMSDGRLVGMLSERDVLLARTRSEYEMWWKQPVREAMRTPVQTAGPDDSLTEAAGRMATGQIDALPIVDVGKLLGIVTITDVLAGEVRSAMAPVPASFATAADVMTPWPYTIRPEATLSQAIDVMLHRHIRHLPVVDVKSSIVGMLSERDIRTAIGDPVMYVETRSQSPAQYHVRDVMSRPAVAVQFDRPLVEVARQFVDTKISALPVVDKFGALIGIVSYVDALRVLA